MGLQVYLAAVVALCSSAFTVANTGTTTGFMPDLGYPEPNWHPIPQGNASAPAVVINPVTQYWGDIEPYQPTNGSLCKWTESADNAGRGSCQTDVSWIHSAVGLSKAVFNDPVVNYILRFQVQGACYRSTQYSENGIAQFCAPWWRDDGTEPPLKINVTHICYEITREEFDPLTGANVIRKEGCAHKAPVEGAAVFEPVTQLAPPGTTSAVGTGTNTTGVANATEPVANGTVAATPVVPVAGAAPVAAPPVGAVATPAVGVAAAPAGTVAAGPAVAVPVATAEAGATAPVAAMSPAAAADGTVAPPPADAAAGGVAVAGATPARRLAQATDAPATVATAPAPAPPSNAAAGAPASAPAVMDGNATDAGNVTLPTAASDPNVTVSDAVQDGRAISSRDQFFTDAAVYSDTGLEFFEPRQQWYDCKLLTVEGTEGRLTCQLEAFGKNFGLNGHILQQMLIVMQKDPTQCSANFAANAANQGTVSNQQWCEVDTAQWIQDNVLPTYDIIGTPEMPQSLDPTITVPPPPPPPDPPLPSPPNAPPLGGTEAVDDVFATSDSRSTTTNSSLEDPGSPAAPTATGGWHVAAASMAGAVMLALALV